MAGGKGEFVENGPEVVKYQDKWASKPRPPLVRTLKYLGNSL